MIEEPPKLTIRSTYLRPTASQILAFKNIPTGFLCDALGGGGAMDSAVEPLCTDGRMALHACGPALVADNGPAEILATMGALHIAQPGDLVVAATGGHMGCSACGDQFTGMLRNKGVVGFVTDGLMRDFEGIIATGMPAWCAGLSPASPYSNGPGRVGFGAIVGGLFINSGDMIVADRDGVVVVPFDQIDEVIAQLDAIKALEITLEDRVKNGYADVPRVKEMLNDGSASSV